MTTHEDLDRIEARIDEIEQGLKMALKMAKEGLRELTVIGFYTDTLDEQNYYASHFWAEDSEHAIEQARNEVGEEAGDGRRRAGFGHDCGLG